MSKKRLLFLSLSCVLIAATGLAALNDTWTYCTVRMHAGTATVVTIGQFLDCSLTVPLDAWDWAGVVQGETYQLEYYIKNTGTVGVYVTYLPTDEWFGEEGGQNHFVFTVFVIEEGDMPDQLHPTDEPIPLPEKDPSTCENGYFQGPGKIAKIRIEMFVDRLEYGGMYEWDFTIYGCRA